MSNKKTVFLDTEVAIEQGDLLDDLTTTEAKNSLAKEIIDKHRAKADQIAREVGGRVRLDRAPETYIRRGSDILHGGDFLLSAMRWAVLVPNSFDPQRASAASR